jgi:hypothetical protein
MAFFNKKGRLTINCLTGPEKQEDLDLHSPVYIMKIKILHLRWVHNCQE